jgi:hypothetical protein
MRIHRAAAVVVVAASAMLAFAGVASAQDRDCSDFSTQAEAQDALQPGDPERLDDDNDGIACETLPAGSSSSSDDDDDESESNDDDEDATQVRTLPRGGVDTGDGSTVGR